METWTKPLPLQEFPAKALLYGVGTTNKPPGGLRKSDEARAFRRKLMRRPIAVEGRHKVPPTAYAGRHSPSVCARCAWTPSGWIESAPCRKVPGNHLDDPLEVLQSSKSCVKKLLAVAGRLALLRAAVQRLLCCGWRWPLKDSRYKLILSAALQAQPGKQKWSLILPSSARVSELTYVTIIGTRYPELDNFQNDIIQLVTTSKLSNALEGAF